MSGKSKQLPFEIVEVIAADNPDTLRRAAAYTTMINIALRLLETERNSNSPPE